MPDEQPDASREANSPSGPAAQTYPLIRFDRAEAAFAYRRGEPITVERFLQDVGALAAILPPHRHVLNLCTDRYRFAVGLGAALRRRQISLLPPNDTPGVLADLAEDYADLYCLSDGAAPAAPIPCLRYPDEFAARPALAAIPVLPARQPAVLLFTSGSTGRPKAAAKSWGTLVRSARAAGARLGIGALPGASIVGTVPHQHSYGLESTILLALQHGLALQAERPFYPGDIAAALAALPRPRILVTTPIHIRALLADAEPAPPADLLVSATAPLARELAAEAEARFRAPLLEIYGCSEAGQVAVRQTSREAAWRCLDGITLRQDEEGTWAAGEAVETPTLLHDVIELAGGGSFMLHGRTADMVNIAGKRTSLAHLNHQLAAIDGVLDGVFVVPPEEEGPVTRLAAFVVAPGLAAEAVLAALRERIDAAFLPRPLVFVEALPRNTLGKLPREALLPLVAEGGMA